MSTLKLDNIAVEFLKRCKGEFDSTFTPGTEAIPDADFLTGEEIVSYVNKALQTFFSEIWAEGNVEAVVKNFPELVAIRSVSLNGSSEYTLASPNLDYKALVSIVVDSKFGVVAPEHLKQLVASGTIEQYAGSAEEPIVVESSEIFTAYPTATFLSTTAVLTIIKEPIDPTTGELLTQNGSYDSPFREIWLDKIAEIAYNFYLKDSTVQS